MEHRIVSFEELIAPLSRRKVMVVVECLNIEGCDQPDIMDELTEIMHLEFGATYDDWEDFLDYGFVVFEGENIPEFVAEANAMINRLRHEKFQAVIQSDLFVDGLLLASSWTGESEISDSAALGKPVKSVVIQFPVEKINRRKEPKIEN